MKNKQDRQTPANTSKRITNKHRNYNNKQARNDKVKANISIANHLLTTSKHRHKQIQQTIQRNEMAMKNKHLHE